MNFKPAGASLDADGYVATIDGLLTAPVPTFGRMKLWLENGTHEVELSEVAPNCAIVGAPSRSIEIVDGAPALMTFDVECTEVWRELSFTSGRDGNGQIYAFDLSGAGLVRLTAGSAGTYGAVWAPDGNSVAFLRDGAIHLAESNRMLSPTLLQEPWSDHGFGGLTWSPAGTRLAVEEAIWEGWCPEPVIWTLETGTPGRTPLSTGEKPSWSPDGSRILISYSEEPCGPTGLRMIDPDGANPADLATGEGSDTDGTWSPDGTRIAFARSDEGEPDIYTMAADGSDLRRVTYDPAPDWDPVWSPNGRWIAFVSLRDGNAEIYLVEADGSEPVNLTKHPAPDFDPAWRPEVTSNPRP